MELMIMVCCSGCGKERLEPESISHEPLCADCKRKKVSNPQASLDTLDTLKVERARISARKKATHGRR